MKKFFVLSFLFVICFFANQTFACTTFCLKGKGEMLFGKNYDWNIGYGLIFINKRGVQKSSVSLDETNPAKWISKYGSVTFNQYGRENPNGGMNEAGLVVEVMWLDESIYPSTDKRPTVDVLEWVQYQLDTAATVAEVLKNAEALRIISDIKLHYLVNDKEGNTATIEFVNGKLVTHTGENLAIPTLTNDTYEKSLNYLKTTSLEKAKTESSLDRFARAATKTKEFEKQPRTEQAAINYAFDILTNVAQPLGSTQWSIVYDQKRGKIHFRTRQSPTIKTIDTKTSDYTCGTAVKMLDMNSQLSGDVTAKFTNYTRAANRKLIEQAFGETPGLNEIPKLYRDLAAAYPEEFACIAGGQSAQRIKNLTDKIPFSHISLLAVY